MYIDILSNLKESNPDVQITLFTSQHISVEIRSRLKALSDANILTIHIMQPKSGKMQRLLHTKAINIDDETLYLSTANFSFSAFNRNWFEYYIIERRPSYIK